MRDRHHNIFGKTAITMNYKALLTLVPIAATFVALAYYLRATESTDEIAEVQDFLGISIEAEELIDTRASRDQLALENLKNSLSLAEISRLEGEADNAFIEEPVEQAQNLTQAWVIASASDESPDLYLDASINVYEAVNLTTQSRANRVVAGDTVAFSLPEGLNIEVMVVSSIENSMGGYSWKGYLKGHNDDYPVIYTQGANSSFAAITTENGSYTMEAVNGLGWIYKNPSMIALNTGDFSDQLDLAKR